MYKDMKLVPLTLEHAKTLRPGDIVYQKDAHNSDGTNRRWKVNGKVKTWKRDSSRIRVPIKHGLYSYDYIDESVLDKCLVEER
jgi:hypothetical protein